MHSPEYARCRRKRRHLDYLSAIRHAALVPENETVVVYPCEFCGGLHVGHQTPTRELTLDELNRLGVEFISFRENIDTGGPLGRAIVVIVGAIAELERNLIIERVRAGMRRAKLEGRQIGRRPLDIDRTAVLRDRERGLSLTEVARVHGVSRAMVSKIVRESKEAASHKGLQPAPSQVTENRPPETVA